MEWASESNKLTCDYVYKQIPASQNVDLGGHYFDGAVPIVETQVAKGNNPRILYHRWFADGI